MSEWISVKDRLPEITPGLRSSKSVLVWCPERMNRYTANWTGSYWIFFGGYGRNEVTEEVTHWMQLPEAPASSAAE